MLEDRKSIEVSTFLEPEWTFNSWFRAPEEVHTEEFLIKDAQFWYSKTGEFDENYFPVPFMLDDSKHMLIEIGEKRF